MLMKKFLLLFAALFTAAISMTSKAEEPSQSDYIPFIQEDRVWEYTTTSYPNSDFVILYDMRFDGIVEVNEHKYSRFVNFKATEYRNGIGNEGTDRVMLPASYYREEGKTVYLLMKDGVPAGGEINLSDEYSETVLMDFSLTDGAIFPPGLFPSYEAPKSLHIHYRDNDTEFDAMPGKSFELYSINSDGAWSMYQPVFGEGIGLTTGILPEVELEWNTSNMESFLFCVRDGDEFLYKDYRYDLMVNGTDYVYMMSDDQTIKLRHIDGSIEASGIGATVSLDLYDASGALVTSATGKDFAAIATNALQPGVYVAKASAETIKILVK